MIELAEYIQDKDGAKRFLFDNKNSYSIDGRAWEHGTAIYGRRTKEDGKDNGIVTKSKLVPSETVMSFTSTSKKLVFDFMRRHKHKKRDPLKRSWLVSMLLCALYC